MSLKAMGTPGDSIPIAVPTIIFIAFHAVKFLTFTTQPWTGSPCLLKLRINSKLQADGYASQDIVTHAAARRIRLQRINLKSGKPKGTPQFNINFKEIKPWQV